MGRWDTGWWLASMAMVPLVVGCGAGASDSPAVTSREDASALNAKRPAPTEVLVPNRFGLSRTMNASGGALTDPSNPFFQSLGTNGRSCDSCHVPEAGMTVTPEVVQRRFQETAGLDPIFRAVDGSNSPLADLSTRGARRKAFSMLLDRALIRIGIGIPMATTEFELVSVQDPYGYASAKELSLFRRPLPATNLRFLSTVMWDGRETFKNPTSPTGFATLHFDLADQSNAATLGHAQAAVPLNDAQRNAIVSFEMQLFTAQAMDRRAGWLDRHGAQGGTAPLPTQEFYFGINDPLGGDPTGRPFDPTAMTLYDAWAGSGNPRRAAIARGAALFNATRIKITGVGGLNDELGVPVILGSCTTCHDTPNVGNHSVPLPIDIGLSDERFRSRGMPLYTLRNRATGAVRKTTDPGRALLTGKWQDIGKFKGPVLRGLAARAPYFHNGMADDLEDVVDFYNTRFAIGFTGQEQRDLVRFLESL